MFVAPYAMSAIAGCGWMKIVVGDVATPMTRKKAGDTGAVCVSSPVVDR
jgi:hypothetical protein